MKTPIASKALPLLAAACMLMACLGLSACGGSDGSLKDGTYTGESAVYEGADVDGSGYGVATVTIKDGAIADCTFQTFETDGTLKDENYGVSLSGNENKHKKAQTAVQACEQYAAALVEAGSLDGVDVVSGATINYDQFQEAVEDALAQAKA